MSEELPVGWTWERLEDLTPPDSPIMYGIIQPGPEDPSGIPFVRPTEMSDDGIRLNALRRCAPAIAAKYRRASLRAGDIVLAIVGTIGKVAAVPPALDGGNITQSSARIRPRIGLSTQYLMHVLRAPQLRQQYAAAAFGNAVQRLNIADVRSLLVPLAPDDQRSRIVATVDALRARSRRGKDALDAVPALLDRLRQSILAAAFRGDLTADWREANPDVEPASELLKGIRIDRRRRWEEAQLAKMVAKGKPPNDDGWKSKYVEPAPVDESELPELPKSWCWTTFETVGDVHLGRQLAPQYMTGTNTRPYLRVANIKDDRIDFADINEMDFDAEEFEHYRLRADDLLLSEGQSPELVGQSAIYDGRIEGLCFQKTLHRFRRNDLAPSSAYFQLLCRHYVRSGVFRLAASLTVNIAHLTLVRLKPLPVPLPPREEADRLTACAQTLMANLNGTLGSVRSSRKLVDELEAAVLASAFRGALVAPE